MKNTFLKLTILAALAVSAVSGFAQGGVGFDAFSGLRTLVLAPPATIYATTTNLEVDARFFRGVVKIDLMGYTNNVGDTLTATLQTSQNRTNWTVLTNYATAVPTKIAYTNLYVGALYGSTPPFCTNTWLLPGTMTTPTFWQSGWASSYIVPAAFSGTTGVIQFTNGSAQSVGIEANDAMGYLRVYWTVGGTAATNAVGAFITGAWRTSP